MCASARALQFVADDRDAYVYYRVGEELDLDWDFSDPVQARDLRRWLDSVASVFQSRPCAPFSGAALACASKILAESLRSDKEFEETLLWLRDLSDTIREEELRDCADLLEAAGAVVDYQLSFGISMYVTAMCADGSTLKGLAEELREFVESIW